MDSVQRVSIKQQITLAGRRRGQFTATHCAVRALQRHVLVLGGERDAVVAGTLFALCCLYAAQPSVTVSRHADLDSLANVLAYFPVTVPVAPRVGNQ